MFEGQRILAIIPARGGSKRLPQKNTLPLCGKPLIAWTIEAAMNSRYIDDVIVSTDDTAIATIAQTFGADVPFIRPASLSDDTARSIDVVLHAIDFMEQKGVVYDQVILLQPTSPLRDQQDIDTAIAYYFQRNAQAVIGVCENEHNPIWSNTLSETCEMNHFLSSQYNNARSQDLPIYYRINGAFYMADIFVLKREQTFFLENNIFAYIMAQEHSVDIDTQIDFIIAETLLQTRGL